MNPSIIPRILRSSLEQSSPPRPSPCSARGRSARRRSRTIADAPPGTAAGSPEPGLYLDLENDLEPLGRARLSRLGARPAGRTRRNPPRPRPLPLRGIIDAASAMEAAGHFLILGSASMDHRPERALRDGSATSPSIPWTFARLDPTPDPPDPWRIPPQLPRPGRHGERSLAAKLHPHLSGAGHSHAGTPHSRRDPAPLLDHAAHSQGGLWKGSPSRSLGVDGKTVMRYLDLLVDLLLVRRLPVSCERAQAAGDTQGIHRDSGIVHALPASTRGTTCSSPGRRKQLGGLRGRNAHPAAPDRIRASFYRTATGVEIDLVLELPGGAVWAIEIKRGIATAPAIAPGCLEPDRAVVYGGARRLPGGVEAVGLGGMVEELVGRVSA